MLEGLDMQHSNSRSKCRACFKDIIEETPIPIAEYLRELVEVFKDNVNVGDAGPQFLHENCVPILKQAYYLNLEHRFGMETLKYELNDSDSVHTLSDGDTALPSDLVEPILNDEPGPSRTHNNSKNEEEGESPRSKRARFSECKPPWTEEQLKVIKERLKEKKYFSMKLLRIPGRDNRYMCPDCEALYSETGIKNHLFHAHEYGYVCPDCRTCVLFISHRCQDVTL